MSRDLSHIYLKVIYEYICAAWPQALLSSLPCPLNSGSMLPGPSNPCGELSPDLDWGMNSPAQFRQGRILGSLNYSFFQSLIQFPIFLH